MTFIRNKVSVLVQDAIVQPKQTKIDDCFKKWYVTVIYAASYKKTREYLHRVRFPFIQKFHKKRK